MTIAPVSQNDTFQIWLSKTNQVITVIDALTDGVLYVNGSLIFTNSTFSLSLTSMNIQNNLVVTNPGGNSVILLSSNIAANGSIFATGPGTSLYVSNTAQFSGNLQANSVYIYGQGTSLFVANNITIGGNSNTNNLYITDYTTANKVNANSISSGTLFDNTHRVITSIGVSTTNGLTGATTLIGPQANLILSQTLADSISSGATNEAPTANAVKWAYSTSIVQVPTNTQNQITETSGIGGWSSFNYGHNLLLTTTPGTANPALGIADSTGTNAWAITNGGGANNGSLVFAQMPSWNR